MIESVVGFGCPTGMDRKRFLKPYVGKLKIEDAIKLKVLLHGKSKVIVDKNRLETMFECVERELSYEETGTNSYLKYIPEVLQDPFKGKEGR